MGLKAWFQLPFKFTAVAVSMLTVLLYGGVFTAVLVADQTTDVPKNLGGLNLDKAYADLHHITERPHPYISHANDDVREYLLDRIRPIVASQPYIHLSDDLTSNASYVTARGAAYFEGTNILVMVEGTDAPSLESGGVLFSAHYDSVSTAPGATDNGMSVATLLQMLEYLADSDRRPRRTAVFFFNNGEEDGLNGAHLYFEHPWSNSSTSFINLEGAAAGGRPILFRSTSLSAARSFSSSKIKHPHGNVMSADGFARGVIRSATDFEIFAKGITGQKAGLEGIDFAFYKNRAFYHTPFDSIPGMGRNEGRKSLWAMMDSVRGAGLEMLNRDAATSGGDTGVYFDVLNRVMVTFPLRALFITHVLLLVLGPLVVTGLLAWVVFLSYKKTQTAAGEGEAPPIPRSRYHITVTVIGWAKFWLGLLFLIGLNIALVACYVKINPFIVYSRPYLVLTSFLAISFLGTSFVISLADQFWPSPPSSLKFVIILELYLLTWVFLVGATVAVNNLHVGGVYLVTAWHLCAWLAALIGVAEIAVRAKQEGNGDAGPFDLVAEEDIVSTSTDGHRMIRGVMYQAPEQDGEQAADEIETDPTEITPLMQQHRRRSTGGREYVVGVDDELLLVNGDAAPHDRGYQELGWWIVQMLVLVPLPALLLFQVTLMLQHSLRNTLADGSSPVTVYAGLAVMSILIFINLAPFSHRIHPALNGAVLMIFVLVIAVAWSAFPFTQEAPLKLFFQQSVQLDLSACSLVGCTQTTSTGGVVPQMSSILSAKTTLTGPRGYVDKVVIPELPSSWGKDINCTIDSTLRMGLWSCGWESALLPSPGGSNESTEWFTLHTERLNASSARVSIKGTNTRSCRLYFDTPITHFHVQGSRDGMQPGYEVPESGSKDLILWSRDWEREFVVDVSWAAADPAFEMQGWAACEWAEFASGTAGSPHASVSAQIPALEEVIHFLPLWAVPTKWTYGLVEVWTKFTV